MLGDNDLLFTMNLSLMDFYSTTVFLQVYCVHDVTSIYRVPLLLESQGATDFFIQRLTLNIPSPRPRRLMLRWKELADR